MHRRCRAYHRPAGDQLRRMFPLLQPLRSARTKGQGIMSEPTRGFLWSVVTGMDRDLRDAWAGIKEAALAIWRAKWALLSSALIINLMWSLLLVTWQAVYP